MRSATLLLAVLSLVSIPASALPIRVFVKSTGMDVGACPISAPCRSFAYALTQVAASGEVVALDTAGYGPFAVTQSVTVFAAPGVTAFIAVSSGNGILIDSPVTLNDVIVLRGLALTGTGGVFGVRDKAGHSLAIENCVISGFSSFGVSIERASDGSRPFARIDHSTIRNSNVGVSISNDVDLVGLTVSNSLFTDNGFAGIQAGTYSRVAVTDTTITGSYAALSAIGGLTGAGASQLHSERCTISHNTFGASAGNATPVGQTPNGIIRLAHNIITGNTIGVNQYLDGLVETMTSAGTATNTIENNGTNGTPGGTYTAK